MRRSVLLAQAVLAAAATAIADAQSSSRNLQVLPGTIAADSLIGIMGGFTRALGVRCTYCHSVDGDTVDYARDDKQEKHIARRMLRMTATLNDSQLPALPRRRTPPSVIGCATCHRGLPVPRSLQDTLRIVYGRAGIEAMLGEYDQLRTRRYGDGTFDFGSVPLADLGGELAEAGRFDEAERAHARNVERNPDSPFAKRQFLSVALVNGYRHGVDAGEATWRTLTTRLPAAAFRPDVLAGASRTLLDLRLGTGAEALAVRATTLHPNAPTLWEVLGDAQTHLGRVPAARTSYHRALRLDPDNAELRRKAGVTPGP